MFGEYQKAAYLLDIDLRSGRSRIVLSEKDEPRVELNTTSYAPVAVDVIGNMEEVIWYSHRSGWGHLSRYDARTGRMLNAITQGDWLGSDSTEERSVCTRGVRRWRFCGEAVR